MDLQVLRFFSVIAREGSFLAASQTLGYAQSNLSTKIRQLEEEFGKKLFTRRKQGVTLTEEGCVLLPYAEKMLALSEEARERISDGTLSSRTLSIGSMESAAITFLPEILTVFHTEEPGIELTVETCVSRVATQKVLEHRLDGAFVAGCAEHPDLNSLELFHEKLALLTDQSQKSVEDVRKLLSLPLLVLPGGCTYRQVLETWLMNEGIVAKRIVEFHSLGALLASVSSGLGIALFPVSTVSSFANGNVLVCHDVPPEYRSVPIHFIWRKKSSQNHSLEKFRQLAFEHTRVRIKEERESLV